MDISLTPELERRIAETVASGRYADANAVVMAGLTRLFEVEQARATLDAMIQVGLDQLDRGEGIDGEVSRQRMMARFGPRG